ncbi:MAG: cytochrome c [Bdellovibrionales bacterium]|nr:cytochrome c [Bdellovibrionales bacterium]
MSQKSDFYNRSGLIAFVFSVTFSLALMAYVAFLHPGVKIDQVKEKSGQGEDPSKSSDADGASDFDPALVKKPWEVSAALISQGQKVFVMNCVACHGKEGKGDGPAAAGIVPPPRNLVEGQWKQGGKSKDLFITLSKGITGTSMASFGHLPVVDRWALVHFIRSITKNKVQDDVSELEGFASSAK